jgi:translation initiation factor 3 subunit K
MTRTTTVIIDLHVHHSTTTMPAPTRESVEALLAKAPYSATNQATLEAYVDAQAKGECSYDMNANRSLLRIYQFSPPSTNPTKVALVLLLALLEFPLTDVLALSYLVPARLQKTDACAAVLKCANLLESCKFSEFWEASGSIQGGDDQIKSLVASSTEKLQRAILEVLALTYKTASVSKVSAALNVNSGIAISKLNHTSVESVSGDKVVFVATADNTKRNRVFQDGVNFGAIASMMAKVSSE